MLRSLVLAAGLVSGLAAGVSAAAAADLDRPYRGSRVERTTYLAHGGYHFPDRPYGLAAIPLSVGPSGTYPAHVIGYVSTTCTPYTYRYYGGCSPRGYGVY